MCYRSSGTGTGYIESIPLSVLKYLMSEGCPWNRDFTDALEEGDGMGEGLRNGHIEALEWLVSLGHYTNEELRRVKENWMI